MAIKTKEELFGDDAGNGAKVPVSTSAPAGHGPNNRGVAFGEPVTSAVANRMTYALAENDEDLDARINSHVTETTGAHAASAISITPTPPVFIATNVQAAIDEVGGSIRSHTTETSGAHDASAIYYGGGGNWADHTPNGSTTVEGQLNKIISDLADESGSAKIGVPDLGSGSAISLFGGTLEDQLTQIIGFLNEARPADLSVDHTTFFNGSDWTMSPVGELSSTADSAVICFPIGKPPPGARIDSISVRLNPGGTKTSPNRVKLRLDRVESDGLISSVFSEVENPEGDNNTHTWTVTLASPHVWDPGLLYYIRLVSGSDGVHSADDVYRIWLTLSYS